MEDHMPDFTPPWERIPLYITSFQSSPVRIWQNATTTTHNIIRQSEQRCGAWLYFLIFCLAVCAENCISCLVWLALMTSAEVKQMVGSIYRPERRSWWLQERCQSLSVCSPRRWTCGKDAEPDIVSIRQRNQYPFSPVHFSLMRPVF